MTGPRPRWWSSDGRLAEALDAWYRAVDERAAEDALLDRARHILRLHGHGIGAACLPPCWDPQRRANNLNPPARDTP